MKPRFPLSIFVLMLLLSACGPKTDSPSARPAGQKAKLAQFQYIFSPPDQPASAEVALDETRAAEAVIPLEGGTLSATGADGTRYTLQVPADALLNETKIRLIPAAVQGLPFGSGQTYAAQLEPEGLAFNNYATLTVTPAQEIPIKEQLFFGYQGSGADVTLAPPVKDSNEIKILLLHFSGYGVTKGLLADVEPVRERLGGSAERRLQSRVAEYLTAERTRQLLGTSDDSGQSDLGEVMSGLFEQYEREVLQPRLAAAGESCAAGRLAIQTLLGIERQKQLLGIESAPMDQFSDLFDTVGRVCIKEEYELCAQEHIIHRMIPVWLGFERQMQLLGVSNSALSEYARAMTTKCLTFELVFESQANFDAGYGGGFDSSVKAKVPLRFQADEIKIQGQSALINESFEFKEPGCQVTNNRGGSSLSAGPLVYVTDTHSASDSLGYVRDLKLSFFPERTKESFIITCPDDPPYASPEMGAWWSIFLVLHADEINYGSSDSSSAGSQPPMPEMPDLGALMASAEAGISLPAFPVPPMPAGTGFLITDWEILGGEYFAKKEWIKEDAGLGLVEAGTLKLYHRPEK